MEDTNQANENVSENTKSREPHPCQYCNRMCFGRQCRECHLNMIKEREGTCVDCKRVFNALTKNGSKRKRCFSCQEQYNIDHIDNCPECNQQYHAVLDDGRRFDKCYDCYKKNLSNCKNCGKNVNSKYTFCGLCYRQTERQDKKCKNLDCENTCLGSYCRSCNEKYKRSRENETYISNDENETYMCNFTGCKFRAMRAANLCSFHINEV